MQKYFALKGYDCFQFSYSTRTKTIKQSARQLDNWLISNQITNPYMICHSMGGLVIHAYLQAYVKHNYLPCKVVCLGSPFRGSMVAKKLAHARLGQFLMGVQTKTELVLGVESWPGPTRLGIIAGNKNIGAGRLLGLDSKKPGDGTVLVEETGIQGATDRIILPVSHSQMTFSINVFQQVEYFFCNNTFKHEIL